MWSLRNKVLLGVLLVITLIVICGVAVIYKKDAEMIQDDYCHNLYYRVEQAGKYFDDTMSNIYEISVELTYENDLICLIKQYKQQQTEESAADLAQVLMEYKNKNMQISSICVYIEDLPVIITSEEYPMRLENTKIDLDQSCAVGPVLIKEPYKKEGNVLSFVNNLESPGLEDVTVMVNIQERSIYYNYLDYLDGKKVKAMALVDTIGKVVSAKERNQIGSQFSEELFSDIGSQAIIRDKDRDEIGISYRTPFSQYTIHVVVSTDEILVQLRSLRFFVLTLSIVFILVAFFISYLSTMLIYKPLSQLTETVKEVGKGNLNKRYVVTTRDEVGTLGTNFNNMLDQINELFRQLIKEERLKKDAELDALQYQITPHFMYNTLNTIKCYALTRGEREIADLIACFADLLQTAISKKGSFITLAHEVSIVNKYVILQQFRHGDAFQVDYQIGAASDCYIPRLILQPFVENSIEHGFDMRKGDNKILLEAVIVGNKLVIRVKDNGIGMTQESIEELLSSPAKKFTGMSNIGVSNVKERLSLYFGAEGSVTMEGQAEGIEVIISMPSISDPQQLYKFSDTEEDNEV